MMLCVAFCSYKQPSIVMAGLVPAIHDLLVTWVIMGRRDKPGDDELG